MLLRAYTVAPSFWLEIFFLLWNQSQIASVWKPGGAPFHFPDDMVSYCCSMIGVRNFWEWALPVCPWIGSGQRDIQGSSRVKIRPAGRVRRFQVLTGPVGSGQEVCEMARVGSGFFLAITCRVGSRWLYLAREKRPDPWHARNMSSLFIFRPDVTGAGDTSHRYLELTVGDKHYLRYRNAA